MNEKRFVCPNCKITVIMFKGVDPADGIRIFSVMCQICYCKGPKAYTKIEAFDNWFDMIGVKSPDTINLLLGIE